MIANGSSLLGNAPIVGMCDSKRYHNDSNTSYGLSECGYDLRIKQTIVFHAAGTEAYVAVGWDKKASKYISKRIKFKEPTISVVDGENVSLVQGTRFTLASAIEEFDVPNNLMGVVHDKSTWARRGLSVFNTIIEPEWKGYLTLELVFHGNETVVIPSGSGIAQVIFHKLEHTASYKGKYENQPNKPVGAK